MDTFLFHGKIWQEQGGFADAMVIRRGRIAAVGREEELYPLASGCDFISCQGRTVIPGLFDACLCLGAAASPLPDGLDGLKEAVQIWMTAHPWAAKKGAHLYWRSAGQDLTPKALDQAWNSAPLVLEDISRQRAWANTKGLELLEKQGIPAAFAQETNFDEAGRPAGQFSGRACRMIAAVLPSPPQSGIKQLGKEWLERAAQTGLTTVQSADMVCGLRLQALPVFRQLYRENRLLPRLQFLAPANNPTRGKGPQPLRQWPSFGGQVTTMKRLPRLVWQGGQLIVPVHHPKELEALLEYLRQRPLPEENFRRLTLLGASGTSAEQLGEMGKNGLGVIGFPGQLEEQLVASAGYPGVNPENCCAYRTMTRVGVRVGFGGMDRMDPFGALQKVVCRTSVDSAGKVKPSREAMTVEEGLKAYTSGSAWTDFGEDSIGRFQPGYQADLLVLNQDIFTCPSEEIGLTRPVLTMAAGHVLWRQI